MAARHRATGGGATGDQLVEFVGSPPGPGLGANPGAEPAKGPPLSAFIERMRRECLPNAKPEVAAQDWPAQLEKLQRAYTARGTALKEYHFTGKTTTVEYVSRPPFDQIIILTKKSAGALNEAEHVGVFLDEQATYLEECGFARVGVTFYNKDAVLPYTPPPPRRVAPRVAPPSTAGPPVASGAARGGTTGGGAAARDVGTRDGTRDGAPGGSAAPLALVPPATLTIARSVPGFRFAKEICRLFEKPWLQSDAHGDQVVSPMVEWCGTAPKRRALWEAQDLSRDDTRKNETLFFARKRQYCIVNTTAGFNREDDTTPLNLTQMLTAHAATCKAVTSQSWDEYTISIANAANAMRSEG
ncbi:hypothetical protein M885DRAFT_544023 [Pelagophyceae sp. CCMP2097]|nr:hypothetical protein M885DRAFT_544023 [Pelagophyceae sp. CCMP2097]